PRAVRCHRGLASLPPAPGIRDVIHSPVLGSSTTTGLHRPASRWRLAPSSDAGPFGAHRSAGGPSGGRTLLAWAIGLLASVAGFGLGRQRGGLRRPREDHAPAFHVGLPFNRHVGSLSGARVMPLQVRGRQKYVERTCAPERRSRAKAGCCRPIWPARGQDQAPGGGTLEDFRRGGVGTGPPSQIHSTPTSIYFSGAPDFHLLWRRGDDALRADGAEWWGRAAKCRS